MRASGYLRTIVQVCFCRYRIVYAFNTVECVAKMLRNYFFLVSFFARLSIENGTTFTVYNVIKQRLFIAKISSFIYVIVHTRE